MKSNPKVLLLDIETSPILGFVWELFDQNVALNQIKADWHLLSWSAKWLVSPDKKIVYGPHRKVMYMDQRKEKNIENDKRLLESVWKLLDECDILITQNGKRFDVKKLNARFAINGMKPPSSFKQIDTLVIAKRYFGFTSNKLEYLSNKLCKTYKKQKHEKFSGFELWSECLKGNMRAWKEMERYNRYDVLSLEELYNTLMPWDNGIDFNIYREVETNRCHCGGQSFVKNGYAYTSTGKFQRYKCSGCGTESRSKVNLLTKDKKKSLLSRTSR